MLITEHFSETRAILARLASEGRRPVHVAAQGALHEGQRAAHAAGRMHGDFLAVTWIRHAALPAQDDVLSCGADLVHVVAGSPSDGAAIEELVIREYPPAALCLSEKDIPRLQQAEALAQSNPNWRIISCPVARDVDRIAFCAGTEALSAEARFSARFIPLALEKAREIAARGERNERELIERTLDNLEKPGGLVVTSCSTFRLNQRSGSRIFLGIVAECGGLRLRDSLCLWEEEASL